ncbi:MAG: precorrin-3B C(17)-methyltransferase [Firmicutes bacterium]|nr:precorrin-3B C(17)-methyltransferase [Bacillota bacterium]
MNTLYIVGIGAAAKQTLTAEAADILSECELIVGYTVYIDLIKQQFPQKQYYTSGMTQEKQRVIYAIQQCQKGIKTAIISSGDSGVYGMASLAYELAENIDIEIQVVAGVTACLSGSAVLGAVLSHDFAVISLSDLMTSWELIQKRISLAAQGDFVICFYNPSSKKRKDYLKKACDVILQYQKPETICGIVKNIARKEQQSCIMTLKELREIQTDMFTTVFIGNSQTKVMKGKMVTPRGYTYEK